MKILVDHHHGALLRSMYYLFKKRLNYEVFVPTEMDWLDKAGIYSCYKARPTADQMLNSWRYSQSKSFFTPITFQEFIDRNDIDVVVVSLWENFPYFSNLINQCNKKCKLVLQAGNNILKDHVDMVGAKNLLSSAYPTYVTCNHINSVFYHQEFDLELFNPTENTNIRSVANFKHIMENDFNIILELEKRLPNWEFKCFGALNRDGIVDDNEMAMSSVMRKFGFIFHVKKDEGYGHVLHNAFACGKPCIVDVNSSKVIRNGMYIQNTASFLYENDITTINSNNGIDHLCFMLEKMADNYNYHSNKVYSKFREIVNFEKESETIGKFMESLL